MKHPNVIIILTDDQGFGDMACHGNPVALTPAHDRLHAESVRLNDFHAAPMCTPTRGQLLSGLDAARNGALNVSSGRTMLRADLPTMADMFRANGYRTGLFGKWHLGDNYPYRPQDRGFEESLWFPSSHISSLPDYWENDYFDDVYCKNGTRQRYEGYCTEVFFREAKNWMRDRIRGGEPFFTYLPTNAPHAPLYVPREDREALEKTYAEGERHLENQPDPAMRDRIIRFLAMIRNLDTQMGLLRDFLKQQGVDRDTILIFMTDNGSTFGPQYFNAGMRGGKITLWEGGHRVPCFIHWPGGNLGTPRDINGLTQFQDILPTLTDLCSLDKGIPEQCDGMNLAPVLRGDSVVPEERMLMVNYSRMPDTDYPTPDAKSVMRREGAAVLWKRWRLLEGTELYDLAADPLQENNIIDEHLDIADKMNRALDDWWTGVAPAANEIQYVTIGHAAENPMTLSACEWQDVFVDQQGQVRRGERKNGYWHVHVSQPGTYRFALRRWPAESGLTLTEACPERDLADGHLTPGVALPVTRARLMIGRQTLWTDTAPDDEAAVFTTDLPPGRMLLHTWFVGGDGMPLCGAYYVDAERL